MLRPRSALTLAATTLLLLPGCLDATVSATDDQKQEENHSYSMAKIHHAGQGGHSGNFGTGHATCGTNATLEWAIEGEGGMTIRVADGNGIEVKRVTFDQGSGSREGMDTDVLGDPGHWTLNLSAPEPDLPVLEHGFEGSYSVIFICIS